MTKYDAMREAEKVMGQFRRVDSNGREDYFYGRGGTIPAVANALLLSYRKGLEDARHAVEDEAARECIDALIQPKE